MVDTNEVEVRENTVESFDRKRQKRIFESRLSKMPANILQQPQILSALSSKVSTKQMIDTLSHNSAKNPMLQEYLAENYINSFSDLDASVSYIFEKDNPIIRKVTQNGFDVDSFLEKFGWACVTLIRKLALWNPELVDSISDDDFMKMLKRQYSLYNEDLSYIVAKRTNLLLEFMKTSGNIFSWEKRQYINQLLTEQSKPIEQPITEEPKIEEPQPVITSDETNDEEPKTASSKIIVKVARILDYNGRYKLADKLTRKLF